MGEISKPVAETATGARDMALDGEHASPAAEESEAGRLEQIIESILFAAATPVSMRRLVQVLDGPSVREVQAALARLKGHYRAGERGIHLQEVAGGYQFRTARENAAWVRAAFRDKPVRLGRAALETLAIVAYKQPVTRPEIEAIRGVEVDGVLSTLLSRRLIKIAGRKEAVGRPLLYSTTPEFLETFGLKDLRELPSLKELGPASDAGDDGQNEPETEACGPLATARQPGTEGPAAAQPEGAEPEAELMAPEQADPVTATGTPAENPEPGGDRLAAEGGGTDPGGAGPREWASGNATRAPSERPDGPDHD